MKKTEIVFEDTVMAYNRWVQGIASREHSTQDIPLADIIRNRKLQSYPNNAVAPKPLHPLLDKTPEIVGDILVNLANLKSKVRQAKDSNYVKKSNNKILMTAILHRIKHMERIVKLMSNDFTQLS